MIDYLALALTHALILIAILRVFMRDDLDRSFRDAHAKIAGVVISEMGGPA